MATANTSADRGATEQEDIDRLPVQELGVLEIKESGQSRSQDQDEIDEFEEPSEILSEEYSQQGTEGNELQRQNGYLETQLKVALRKVNETEKENKGLRKDIRELKGKLVLHEIQKVDEFNENANVPELLHGEKSKFDQLKKEIQEMRAKNEDLLIQNRNFIRYFKKIKEEKEELRKENEKLKKEVEDLQKKPTLFQEIPDQAMQPFRASNEERQELHFNSESETRNHDALSEYPSQRLDANEELTENNYFLKEDVEDGKNKQLKDMKGAKRKNEGQQGSTKFLDKIRDLAKDRHFFSCVASCGMYCVFLIFHFMGLKFCQKKFSLEISLEADRPRSKTSISSSDSGQTFDSDACEYFVESLGRLKIVEYIFEDDEIHKRGNFKEVLQKAKDTFSRFRKGKESIGLIIFGYANASVGHCMVIFQDDDEVQIYDVQEDRLWVETQNDIKHGKVIQVALVVEEEAKKLLKTCGVKTCCPA